jgi:hypothetical protein
MPGIQSAFDVYRHMGRPTTAAAVRAAAVAWRARHVAQGHTEYDVPTEADATPMPAYINHSRWLVDCACGNGVPVTIGDGPREAVCFVCGMVWTNPVFPADESDIERLLVQRRHTPTRNWQPGETVADLHRENDEHGVGR